MDVFGIIQDYFTKLSCQFCQQHFHAQGIQLVREEEGVYVVSVYCHHCERHIGIAMVGVETPPARGRLKSKRFKDPELTRREMKRLAQYDPISYDDVLEAHAFFQNLDETWMRHLPKHLAPAAETEPNTETGRESRDG